MDLLGSLGRKRVALKSNGDRVSVPFAGFGQLLPCLFLLIYKSTSTVSPPFNHIVIAFFNSMAIVTIAKTEKICQTCGHTRKEDSYASSTH
jgi:hypothetical protein